MSKNDIKIGIKVHYIPYKGCTDKEYQNGKIKCFCNDTTDYVFVVYHCNNNWDLDHWKDYTGQRTAVSDIKLGWV